ncbi:MAG: GNAT family N-acetyltransferase [Anaerolineae bacterium]|jgi:GNAT superfamily N-acetyltransferase|nr:GNAT family N-acetyltransferase [Anaerolineae bacterium]
MMIRAAKPADAPAIGALWLQLAEYHRGLDDRMPVPAADGAQRYASRIASSLADTHTRVYVAEVDGQPVGYVMGVIVDLLPEMFVEERAGFLADIFVLPSYRQQGTGRALVQALRGWFRARGITHFEWYVASANTAGIAFWQAVGGAEVMLRMRAATDHDGG